MKLLKINEWLNPHKDNKPQWYIDLDVDGVRTEAVCYNEKIKEFAVGDDIPADWTLNPGSDGKKPMLTAPGEQRKGRPPGLSFDERMALDQFQQERMDRRTALMQSVALGFNSSIDWNLDTAGAFYKWLRKTSEPQAASPPRQTGSEQAAPPTLSGGAAPSSSTEDSQQGTAVEGTAEGSGEVTGEGTEPGPKVACGHPSWKPAPNKDAAARGLMVCEKCGHAEKRAA